MNKSFKENTKLLKKTPGFYRKIVVSADEVQMKSRNGIEHIQVWKLDEFLSHLETKEIHYSTLDSIED